MSPLKNDHLIMGSRALLAAFLVIASLQLWANPPVAKNTIYSPKGIIK